jgi:hypothetical protein
MKMGKTFARVEIYQKKPLYLKRIHKTKPCSIERELFNFLLEKKSKKKHKTSKKINKKHIFCIKSCSGKITVDVTVDRKNSMK